MAGFFFDESELLVGLGSEGEDEAGGISELIKEGRGDFRGGAGDEDGIVGGGRWPAVLAVGGVDMDVGAVLDGKSGGGDFGQGVDGFNGVNLFDD